MESNLWQVDYGTFEEEIINCITEYKKIIYLLDTSKKEFDLIEKVVYDIAMFHFNRLNIDFNSNAYFIEFWFKNIISQNEEDNSMNINTFHCDCDENERKLNKKLYYPLLSCVNYFNDNKFPTLLTDINFDNYKFKTFENKNNIQLIFPNKNKQLTFNGKTFHGVIDIFNQFNQFNIDAKFDRYMLAINLWNKKPLHIEFYNNINANNYHFSKDSIIVKIKPNNLFKNINFNENIFDFNFYEQMLYNKKQFKMTKEICDYVKNEMNNNSDSFIINCNKKDDSLTENNNNSNIIKDINLIKTQDIFYNRFLQRFSYKNLFSKNVCNWIIFESEKYAENNGGWTTRRHENYPTTDIPVKNIQNIFNFVLFSFIDIFDKIKKSYCLTDEVMFNINDLFIVKYNEETQNKLDLHFDGSFLSINILLSNPENFEGGGTYFDDGLSVFLEQGDLLVHSGKVKHAGMPVTKGTRYIMVAFVEIDVKLNNI